jgi:hypothetical protein
MNSVLLVLLRSMPWNRNFKWQLTLAAACIALQSAMLRATSWINSIFITSHVGWMRIPTLELAGVGLAARAGAILEHCVLGSSSFIGALAET